MKTLSLLAVVVSVLFGSACGGGGADVASPQTPRATPRQTAGAQPAATVLAPEPTVAATARTEPAVVPWDEAVRHIGEERSVCGPVVHSEYASASRGQPTYLDIGTSYLDPAHFTVVIWGESRGNFQTAPEDTYVGETVCVGGLIEAFQDAAQVVADSPSDIVVLTQAPPAEPATPVATAATEPPQAPDFTAFAGDWGRHGFGMTVAASGEATATWRTYKWCSDDPTPPCDAMVDSDIISGGHATFVFDRVVGPTAYGRVTESNDQEFLGQAATLTLQPYGMALLETDSSSIVLCGPDYWRLAPPSVQETSPCGA